MQRREFLTAIAAAATAAAQPASKGRLKQAVTRGVFGRGANFEESCRTAADLGIKGFDLIGPNDWPTLKKYGLVPTMYPPGPGGNIPEALNRKENHERLEKLMHAAIDVSVRFGTVSLTSGDILDLQVGDVVPLHHHTTKPLTVLASGIACLNATPGRRGKRLACMIVDPPEDEDSPSPARAQENARW